MAEARKLTSASKDGNCMLSFVYSAEVEKALDLLKHQEELTPRDSANQLADLPSAISLLTPRISPRHLKCLEVTNTDLCSITSDHYAARFQERFDAKTKEKSLSLSSLATPRANARASVEITGLDSIFEDLVSDGVITLDPKDSPGKPPGGLNTEDQQKPKTKVQIQINVNE